MVEADYVKVSGDCMRTILILPIMAIAIFCCPNASVGGNKLMMEKNRDELLMLNSKLLENLENLQKDGTPLPFPGSGGAASFFQKGVQLRHMLLLFTDDYVDLVPAVFFRDQVP